MFSHLRAHAASRIGIARRRGVRAAIDAAHSGFSVRRAKRRRKERKEKNMRFFFPVVSFLYRSARMSQRLSARRCKNDLLAARSLIGLDVDVCGAPNGVTSFCCASSSFAAAYCYRGKACFLRLRLRDVAASSKCSLSRCLQCCASGNIISCACASCAYGAPPGIRQLRGSGAASI